jgi:alkylation response protein AidB-like acyl-CoA dehydrogenase
MDFNFSDEQEQLRDAARRWVSKDYGFERRKAVVAAGGFDAKAYESLAELGLTALTVPEAHGGLGLGAVDAMVVMEELGRGMVLEPLAQSLMASRVLSTCASDALQAAWLPKLASGEALISLAYQEHGARYQLDACKTTAQASAQAHGNAHSLRGAKVLVAAGDKAQAYIVSALLGDKLALFVVDAATAGVAAQAVQQQDGSRAARVTFSNAAATLLSTDGLAALELAVDTGIAALCAEGQGVMDMFVQMTVDYMNTRKQFGQTLASFQALRFRMADVKMQLELARSMSYYATLKLDAPAPERRAAMARAKHQLGQSMRFVSQNCLQLHGGIGMTDEYSGSHAFKKLTQMEMQFGDSLHHLGEVSARMQDTAGVFA